MASQWHPSVITNRHGRPAHSSLLPGLWRRRWQWPLALAVAPGAATGVLRGFFPAQARPSIKAQRHPLNAHHPLPLAPPSPPTSHRTSLPSLHRPSPPSTIHRSRPCVHQATPIELLCPLGDASVSTTIHLCLHYRRRRDDPRHRVPLRFRVRDRVCNHFQELEE